MDLGRLFLEALSEALEERTISKEDVLLGLRVVRGPDWRWKDQDKGEGQVGTVVELKLDNLEVIVYWDSGTQANYRVGNDGDFDLLLLDSSPTGVKHEGCRCAGCGETDVVGMRWTCSACSQVHLCTKCYMGDKHSLQHAFVRYELPKSAGVLVEKRAGSEKIPMNGIFVGSRVVRGRDWKWETQDKVKHPGVECDVCHENPVVGVRWKCRSCGDNDLCSDCYQTMKHPQHGFWKIKTPNSEKVQAEPRDPGTLLAGNLFNLLLKSEGIQLDLNGDSEEKPGEVIGLDGTKGWVKVKWSNGGTNSYRLGNDGKVDLKYTSCTTGGTYYKKSLPVLGKKPDPSTIFKRKLSVGDVVCVNVSLDEFKSKQAGHGGWAPRMAEIRGKQGKVVGHDSSDNLRVEFSSTITYTLNPEICIAVTQTGGGSQTSPARKVPPPVAPKPVRAGDAGGQVMVAVMESEIKVGDSVLVNMEEDLLKMIQESQTGWLPAMGKVIGKIGKVTMATDKIIMVSYEGDGQPLPFTNGVVTKVKPVNKGDNVLISNDVEMVHKVQEKAGGWVPDMADILGMRGVIETVLGENLLIVHVGSHSWCLHASLCTLVAKAPITQAQGDGRETDSGRDTDYESLVICSICMDNQRSMAFGCGHMVCSGCADKMTDCHICRRKITQRINLYH